MFDEQVAALTAAGYRVLTWDVRGHGLSKPLGQAPIRIADLTDDLVAILDQLGETSPICIGGQSMGGYLAQDFVRRMPYRVAAVVLVGAACTSFPIPWWQSWALRSSTAWFYPWPWPSLRRTMAKAIALRPEVRDYAFGAMSLMTKRDFIQIWKGVARAIDPDPSYRLPRPFLLTHGQSDRTGTIAREAPAWAAREPMCRYEVIPDASHNANQDNPESFNAFLLEFLSTHYPVRRS